MMVADLPEQLAKQLLFIKNSAEMYDRGDVVEAVRLATAMRVLMHDTGNSTSLLNLMQSKGINLVSSIPARDMSRAFFFNSQLSIVRSQIQQQDDGALSLESSSIPLWSSTEDRVGRLVNVTDWWNEPVYFVDGTAHTRREIVLAAANKDGGAHVDRLPTMYASLQNGDQLRTKVTGPDATGGVMLEIQIRILAPGKTAPPDLGLPVKNAAYADLRQMAYELLDSPELLGLAQ